MRRSAVAAITVAVASVLAPAGVRAQDYPNRTVTIIVPYGPGSYTDNVLRPVAVGLQKLLQQPVVIDNKAGANGVIGTQFVARAKPDGYTLLAGSVTNLAANAGLFKILPYDPQRDFVPVAGVASTSMMFMVRPELPVRDIKGFLAYAARQPQPLSVGYGSSSAQVALAQVGMLEGTRFNGVPYKGTPQAITDLLGGQIPAAIVDVSNGVPYLRSGKLIAVATSAAKRSVSAPDVPTLSESYPGSQLVTWVGLVAPTGTPQAVVNKLHQAVAAVIASPEIKQQFATLSTDVEPMSGAEMALRMRRDQVMWLDLIKAAGIEPQ